MACIAVDPQDFFNSRPSEYYPYIWHGDRTADWLLEGFSEVQSNPDLSCTSGVPHENALGLFDVGRSGSVYSEGGLARTCTTTTSNFTDDTQIFDPSFFHQQPSIGDQVHFEKQSAPYPFMWDRLPLATVGEMPIPCSNRAVPAQESHIVQRPITGHLHNNHHANASGQLPTPHKALRSHCAPYPPIHNDARPVDASPTVYYCQWFDDSYTSLCGAAVAGTKRAIWEHLNAAHVNQLRGEEIGQFQVCQWEGCYKSMRRESIARHVLAVHMQEKVRCPICRSSFSRPDSLQRHQKGCASKREDAPEASTLAVEDFCFL